MSKYLFKPKKYGYGFTPVSLGGWIATLVLLGIVLGAAYVNGIFNETVSNMQVYRYILDLFLIIGVFTYWAEKHCDGEVKWRWGK